MPNISLIISTYNRDKFIYECLKCIAISGESSVSYEIVLVNNNSTDSTESECERFAADFPQVPFKYFIETQQGLSFARNRGINEAKGDVLVFLDDDAMVCQNYLALLQKCLNEYADTVAFGGKIKPRFENGVTPKWLSKWTYSLVSAIDMGDKVRLFRGNKYPIGANMGFRRATLESAGAFNTELGRAGKNLMAGEEKDIFNRIKVAGGNIYYFPEIEVEHVIPPNRTTYSFIAKMGIGIGKSERVRAGVSGRINRLILECVKWAASIILFVGYTLLLQPAKGYVLILLRYNVTKGLLGRP
ncbi:MAG: glycosyltransferase [Bacteroidales bacterium]|jgi:glycosyltransferase involved in cell wall biosynthesis|nr:glycosyltransferase [Bacteroidales bacterium]